MAETVVITSEFDEIEFGATGATEILQNVRTILRSVLYSSPMYRTFGWDSNIDTPVNAYMAITSARLIEAIHIYEPRAEVQEVTYEGDVDGKLKPKVRAVINSV